MYGAKPITPTGLSSKKPTNILAGAVAQDELGELPIGWSKITIQTRKENPEWNMVQAVKGAMVQQLETQIDDSLGEDEKNVAKISIKLQVEAQFCSLEDRMSQFLVDERVAFIADPSSSKDIEELYNKLITDLDLEEDEEE